MEDNRFKPYWLPQMSAPFKYVVDQLGNEGFKYKHVFANPKQLKPTQKVVDSNKIDYFNSLNSKKSNIDPIYISSDNEIIDGHHRYFSAKHSGNDLIHCIKVFGYINDVSRVLNKIQDIFDYKNKGDNSGFTKIGDKPSNISLKLFRKDEIKENSEFGNFFFKERTDEEYKFEYDIVFDNIYYISDDKVISSKNPVVTFAQEIAPSIEINNNEYAALIVNNFMTKLGYDGVDYGKYVQAIKPKEHGV